MDATSVRLQPPCVQADSAAVRVSLMDAELEIETLVSGDVVLCRYTPYILSTTSEGRFVPCLTLFTLIAALCRNKV
jgi:hypothetical protein